MSLSVDDFFEAFSKAELKEVPLTTMGGRTVFLRALPYAKVWHFRMLASKIDQNRTSHIFKGGNINLDISPEDKVRAEDYLLDEALAQHDGSKLFQNQDQFNEWREVISTDVVNEILFYIDDMNELADGFKNKAKIVEDFKAKKK